MLRNPSSGCWSFSLPTSASTRGGSSPPRCARVICQRLLRGMAAILPAVEVHDQYRGSGQTHRSATASTSSAAIELGEGDGMQSFEQSLMQLLNEGRITQEEALATYRARIISACGCRGWCLVKVNGSWGLGEDEGYVGTVINKCPPASPLTGKCAKLRVAGPWRTRPSASKRNP